MDLFDNIALDNTGKYIINEQSHTIYYYDGVTINDVSYYALPLTYTDIEYNSKAAIDKISVSTIYLPMGGTTLNLEDYIIFTDSDGNITTPKSITYTVSTSGYSDYFSIDNGKIISDEDMEAIDSVFEIEVVATSYDNTEQTATLKVYLTDLKILDSNAKNEIEEISVMNGNSVTVYVQCLGNAGTLSIVTNDDEIKVDLSDTSETKNSKTVYELTIKGIDVGSATLSIIEGNGNASKDITINVYEPEVDKTAINFASLGETETVTVTVGNNFDIDEDENYINWTSSDESVATVDGDGLSADITSEGYGIAIIYCEIVSDDVEIATLKIGVAVTGIDFDGDINMEVEDEETVGINLESVMSSTSFDIDWTSSADSVVSIGDSGFLYVELNALSIGEAEITLEISIDEDDDGDKDTFSYTFTVIVN